MLPTGSLFLVLYYVYLPHRLTAIIPEIMYVEGRLLARAVMLLSLLVTGDEV